MRTRPAMLLATALGVVSLGSATWLGTAADAAPGDGYTHPHPAHLPAGCVADLNPANPDNHCFHELVDLNGLDDPKIDVAILVPISPEAERDRRIAVESLEMWKQGISYLSKQMNLDWLDRGVKFRITSQLVATDSDGTPLDPVNLVDPEIVVTVSNPVGGLGIGIDPVKTAGQTGLTGVGADFLRDFVNIFAPGTGDDVDDVLVGSTPPPGEAPCVGVPDPFDMNSWQASAGFEQHGGEPGGTYVADCETGGNVCFSVNNAIDPVPGSSDFFALYDLISHETGHCLTLGHVGDGADGPWGPTPTNDIMAYSTDPVGIAKCASTLNVETFAHTMSRYIDVNGDASVNDADFLPANDLDHDWWHGSGNYLVQNPADHKYASSTGKPSDCPQPDYKVAGLVDPIPSFTPTPTSDTKPVLSVSSVSGAGRKVSVTGTARRVPTAAAPTATSASTADSGGDAPTPYTDITKFSSQVTASTVEGQLKVAQLWDPALPSAATAYSIQIESPSTNGFSRRFDSFVANGDTSGTPQLYDNGARHYMPAGSVQWDKATNTVSFHVSREYLADQGIVAPYRITGVTGLHERTKDWLWNDDVAPNKGGFDLTGPAMTVPNHDLPVASSVTTKDVTFGAGSFDVSNQNAILTASPTGVEKDVVFPSMSAQSTVRATLSWTPGDILSNSVEFHIDGGSEQREISRTDSSITVEVPWARRNLTGAVIVEATGNNTATMDFKIEGTVTTVVADGDHDGVPDVADSCPAAAGPSASAGCPDTDQDGVLDVYDACPKVSGLGYDGCALTGQESIVLYVDGKLLATQPAMTKDGSFDFALSAPSSNGTHIVKIAWLDKSREIASVSKTVRVTN